MWGGGVRERETDRQRERDRLTDKQTERGRDRQRVKQKREKEEISYRSSAVCGLFRVKATQYSPHPEVVFYRTPSTHPALPRSTPRLLPEPALRHSVCPGKGEGRVHTNTLITFFVG